MPSKARTPCRRCGAPSTRDGRCARHAADADRSRGTSAQRGYSTHGHVSFRAAVLARDAHVCALCGRHATVADHHPLSRRELLRIGADADDPQFGRALCERCHNGHTATAQSRW